MRWFLFWVVFLALELAFLALQLNNPFYADDYYHLAFLKFMQDPLETIWQYNFGKVFWRPLMMSADLLLLRTFGMNTLGWHAVDLALQSLNALLVSVLAFRLLEEGDERWRTVCAFLAGLVFAIHPVALLPTAWMACRGDLMAVFFALLTLLLLASALKSRKLVWLKLLFAIPLSLCALFSKETMLVLPGVALCLGFLFPARQTFLRRTGNSLIALIPVIAAAAAYLLIRFRLLGGLGGYETIEFSAGFILPRLLYHVPRVLDSAFRDYFAFHIPSHTGWFRVLIGALLAGSVVRVLHLPKSLRLVVLALLWVLISLAPLWNISHMLAFQESRLFYFGLAGFAIAVSAAAYAIRDARMRALFLAAFLVAMSALAVNARHELSAFRQRCLLFEQVKAQVLRSIPADETRAPVARVYIYGLDFDFYYLDPALKVDKPDWLNKLVIPADAASLAWVNSSVLPLYTQATPRMPEFEVHYSDRKTAAATVRPPADLIGAAVNDPQSLVLEWELGRLKEISQELLTLSRDRRYMEDAYLDPYRIRFLPTYDFRKRNYALDWKLSPGLSAPAPEHLGELYTFYSTSDDPYLVSPEMFFQALAVADLEFNMRIMPKPYLAPQEREGCFFWMTDRDIDWKPTQKICFPIEADGKFHNYLVHTDFNLYWLRSMRIAKVRLDPIAFPGWFQIDTLRFSPAPGQ
jgi:hypothetical protein